MNTLKEKSGVWFVYDGDCPVCTYAANALRIKQEYGSLSTLDAREAAQDPLLKEIHQRGLDLDEGMVIYVDGNFYHGQAALQFMARHGDSKNLFMTTFKGLFWSDAIARLTYPWMRACRNWLLRRHGKERIDNLDLKQKPIFKPIFGKDWDGLPPVMKRHYANCPYTTQVTYLEGTLDVYCKPPLRWISPLINLLGQIPAFTENHVPVTVRFESDPHTRAFHFNRSFEFSGRAPYRFRSRMLQTNGNEVVEIMKFGLGWKTLYSWDGQKVIMKHKGYALHFLGHLIPLPLTPLLGAGNASEHPVDENTFDMEVKITHVLWGDVYGYKGRFRILQ